MITKVRHIINGHGDLDPIKHLQENHTVTILDARKHNPGTFSETGFTLVKLDEEPGTKNWRHGSQDIHLFQEMMNPHLMKLYPETKKILWLNNVVRGGDKPLDQPAAPAPHLDYYQDDEARLEFHKTNPLIDLKYSERNVSENHVLTGYYDTEDLKVGVMLGVWKPLNPTQRWYYYSMQTTKEVLVFHQYSKG